MDRDGCALAELTATTDNFWEIAALLPDKWKNKITFRDLVWQLPIVPPGEIIPLKIANAPVLLTVSSYRPPLLEGLDWRGPDPCSKRLDPLKSIPEDVLRIAGHVFPLAHSILLFFSGELFVAFGADQEDNLDQLYKTAPHFFGGCPVYIMPLPCFPSCNVQLCNLEALVAFGRQEVQ